MPYILEFRNKFTKNKWTAQCFLYNRKKQAQAALKDKRRYEKDDRGNSFKTEWRMITTDRNDPKYKHLMHITLTS